MKKSGLWLTILKLGMWVGFAQGVMFSLVAVGFAVSTTVFVARSVRAEGTVTALAQFKDDDGSITSRPVFSFVTRDGKTQTVQSHAGSNPSAFDLGEQIPVRYEPADPSSARINTVWQTWPFPISFAIAACVTGLIGWLFRWRLNKRLAAPPKLKKIPSLDVL